MDGPVTLEKFPGSDQSRKEPRVIYQPPEVSPALVVPAEKLALIPILRSHDNRLLDHLPDLCRHGVPLALFGFDGGEQGGELTPSGDGLSNSPKFSVEALALL